MTQASPAWQTCRRNLFVAPHPETSNLGHPGGHAATETSYFPLLDCKGDSESDFRAVFGALSVTITSPIAIAEATKFVGSKNKDEKDTGLAIGQLKRESDQPAEATNMKYIARIAIHGTLRLEA